MQPEGHWRKVNATVAYMIVARPFMHFRRAGDEDRSDGLFCSIAVRFREEIAV